MFVIGRAPGGALVQGNCIDTPDPITMCVCNRFRRHNFGPRLVILIVGGADHKTGQADDAEARYSVFGTMGNFESVSHTHGSKIPVGQTRKPTTARPLPNATGWTKRLSPPVFWQWYNLRGTIADKRSPDFNSRSRNVWAALYVSRRARRPGAVIREGNHQHGCLIWD